MSDLAKARFQVGDKVGFASEYLRKKVTAEPLSILDVCPDGFGGIVYSVDGRNYLDESYLESA